MIAKNALGVLLLTGCVPEPLTGMQAEQMAQGWAAKLGYEDARLTCGNGDREPSHRCSVRTSHAQNPIVIDCRSTGCVQQVR